MAADTASLVLAFFRSGVPRPCAGSSGSAPAMGLRGKMQHSNNIRRPCSRRPLIAALTVVSSGQPQLTILNAPLELRSLNSRRPARDQSDFVASQNGPFQFRGEVQGQSDDCGGLELRAPERKCPLFAARIRVLAAVCRINALWRLRCCAVAVCGQRSRRATYRADRLCLEDRHHIGSLLAMLGLCRPTVPSDKSPSPAKSPNIGAI